MGLTFNHMQVRTHDDTSQQAAGGCGCHQTLASGILHSIVNLIKWGRFYSNNLRVAFLPVKVTKQGMHGR